MLNSWARAVERNVGRNGGYIVRHAIGRATLDATGVTSWATLYGAPRRTQRGLHRGPRYKARHVGRNGGYIMGHVIGRAT